MWCCVNEFLKYLFLKVHKNESEYKTFECEILKQRCFSNRQQSKGENGCRYIKCQKGEELCGSTCYFTFQKVIK